MQINVLSQDKHSAQIQLDNVTVAEIVRVYAYKVGAEFVAWRREHPSKPIVLLIKGGDKSVSKILADIANLVGKDSNSIVQSIKK